MRAFGVVINGVEYCNYPDCHCPFDAPAEPKDWCACNFPPIEKAPWVKTYSGGVPNYTTEG
jgi:hypothetical protein